MDDEQIKNDAALQQEKNLRFTQPPLVAGGLPAVTSSMQYALGSMGPLRGMRALLQVNQTQGFDCPGCAWPDPDDHRSMTEFCENGAKALAEEGSRKKVDPDFFKKWSLSELLKQSDHWLGKQGRLTHPMCRQAGKDHYETISWERAFSLIADELKALSSPDEAIFYTSGRTSNEAAFLYQLMVRLLGTNNLPDCSNMCHESSGVGLTETIGIGKGTVTLADFDHADLIIIMGQNPGTNHPRMLSTLQKAARRGARILSVNPLLEVATRRFAHPQDPRTWLGLGLAETDLACLHHPVRINGDVALLKAWMKILINDHPESIDHDFIQQKTNGYEAFLADLQSSSLAQLLQQCGLEFNDVQQSAAYLAQSQRTIVCWAMGLTQHVNAVANIQSIVNLMLMRGQMGKPGAGLCPVRGHSNVQGDRTMGIWERPSVAFLDALEKSFKFKVPREPGYDTVAAIEAMRDQRAKVFIAMGGNFLSASPDTAATSAALQNLRLTVQISTQLNRSHLVTGDQALILPCLGRSEEDRQMMGRQFVSVENSMGIVHRSEGRLKPASPALKSEVAIVCMLARKLFPQSLLPWELWQSDYNLIREKISQTLPGFERFNQRVREKAGFYLPNPIRDECRFPLPGGRARFTVHAPAEHDLKKDEYLLMSIRSHDQFNTTIYGLNDRYRGVSQGRRVLFINEKDLQEIGHQAGDFVDIVSEYSGQQRVIRGFKLLPYVIPRRCLAIYFPEANPLVPLELKADHSHTPASKSLKVRLKKTQIAITEESSG